MNNLKLIIYMKSGIVHSTKVNSELTAEEYRDTFFENMGKGDQCTFEDEISNKRYVTIRAIEIEGVKVYKN